MNKILFDLSPQTMISSNEGNIYLFWDYYFGCTTLRYGDGSKATKFVSEIPFPLFNGILSTRFTGDVDVKILELRDTFDENHLPFFWWVSPSDQPGDIGAALESNGFVCAEVHPGMSIDLNMLEPEQVSGLEIHRVNDEVLLRQWVHTMFLGSGFPLDVEDAYYHIEMQKGFSRDIPVQRYIAFSSGRAVATSLAFLASGVAGIYGVSTLGDERKKGFGSAITRAALMDARSLGYGVGILQTSEMGRNMYRRMGFREYFDLQVYAQPHTMGVF